jgi:hypothetical protein
MHKSASADNATYIYKQRARRAHQKERYIQTGVQERSFKRGGRCQVIYSFVYISLRECVLDK